MTQAIMKIGRTVSNIEAKSVTASRGARLAIGFGLVAAAYAVVIVEGLQHASFTGLS
jgi:hypothetical protein